MADQAFTVTHIDLTHSFSSAAGQATDYDKLRPDGFTPEYAEGERLRAKLYNVKGADGTTRTLSMAGLVMALCLARATALESGIIEIMQTMERTTEQLENLTRIEEALIGNTGLTNGDRAFLDNLGVSPHNVTAIEAKMDSLNSFSQETMIELQSQTNKRDQAYDMAANILKGLNGVQIGIANNL